MDETRFDRLTRRLARAASRRRVLGGMLGGTFALVTGSSALAQRGRLRRRRDGRRGEDEPVSVEGAVLEGVLAGGVFDASLNMCHFDPETGTYNVVPVSTIEVPDRLARGDTLYIDCCVASDCVWRPCLTLSGCFEGACAYDATVNAPCELGNGLMGICRSAAVCASVRTGAQVSQAPVR